ncbi:hypothetical protein HJC23_013435 [Cyclotella cryptica]|uniref:Uncharacterized protein n=1 Tax=Cyclotella cryptica TaxID=29204 RepID=A0ABD3P4Z9_9STRA|eukprot:CCRYP_017828-RA/>CCRYP_017828-RA protein AED:0.18 eAED:0.18 QI:0/-1/0/1/-1/1/1/0/641
MRPSAAPAGLRRVTALFVSYPTMGRKKGKQCGSFHCKKLNAEYHHKLFVDNASEADQYRNPISKNILGKGLGYRSAASCDDNSGRWDSNGRSCHGDKWSSIFANRPSGGRASGSTRSNASITRESQNAARGLAHLRHLLEERRSEDRYHDRQFRLALQRSRIRDAHLSSDGSARDNTAVEAVQSNQHKSKTVRNEPGWLLSHSFEESCDPKHSAQLMDQNDDQYINKDGVPSLQSLTARVLGPLLPVYVAACGHEFVGECLKSASPEILAILSVALAKSAFASCHGQEDTMNYATTDGAVKALAYSGLATGLVLKGAPPMMPTHNKMNEEEIIDDNDDTRWLSDRGLLALRPRLLPHATKTDDVPDVSTSITGIQHNDDWETLDVDLDLTARMAGCFHLTRLELVDIPLQSSPCARGGITLGALRALLQSCPGITHLALTGSFYNWDDSVSNVPPHVFVAARDASEDVNFLLSGTPSTLPSAETWNGNPRDRIGQYHYDQSCDQACDIKGLHQLLPDLQVLDVSNCSWITPPMIFRFLLQCRDGMTKLCCVSTNEYNPHRDKCDKNNVVAGSGEIDQISETCDEVSAQPLPSISLRLLAVKGCDFSLADARMIEEWAKHSLSGNVALLTGLSERTSAGDFS